MQFNGITAFLQTGDARSDAFEHAPSVVAQWHQWGILGDRWGS